ncbi:MAG: efflux RND transporter permease subunit [Alphaproteobacteria bacterium]
MTELPKATKTRSFAQRWGEWVVRYRWPVMIISILVALAAGSGAGRLTFVTDYQIWFSKENPELRTFQANQKIYTKLDNIMFVVVPKSGKVFEGDALAAVEALTKAAWKLPYSKRVDSVTNFQYSRAKGDELIVADLVENAKTKTKAELAMRQKEALSEPGLKGRLIPTRAHVTGVNVTLVLPESSTTAVTELVAASRKLAKAIAKEHPAISIRLTGTAMLDNAFSEASQQDGQLLIPIMFGVLLVVMAVLLRSIVGVVATLLVVVLSVVFAMGSAGYAGIALTPPSAMAPTMIMTLAVADSIHFLVTMFSEMRKGRPRREAVVESMRVNFTPIVLTSVTTAIGFLSMNSSDAPPFWDMGNITATGVLAALVLSLLFLPAFVAIVPIRARSENSRGIAMMDRLADFVIARRRPLLYGMGAVIVVLFAFIPRIELNDQFVKFFDERVQFRTDTDFMTKNLTGIYQVEVSVPSGRTSGITGPQFLKALDKYAAWLRAQPETVHVSTITDTMKRLNRNMHADDPAWYKLPNERNLSAQYLLLFEMSLPFGLDLNDQINVDKSATRLLVTLRDVSAGTMRDFEQRLKKWQAANLPAGMRGTPSGASLMFAHISERNITNMLLGTFIALVLISGLLILAFRSLKIGLISLIPNLVPAGMGFGLWSILVGQVGLAVAVVAAMTLGIVVDDTIHFLSKYLRARREHDASPKEAVRTAFHTVGVALTVSTLVLMAGFLVLAGSSFSVNADMGLLTATTIGIALLVDFLLLPPLLMTLEEKSNADAVPQSA